MNGNGFGWILVVYGIVLMSPVFVHKSRKYYGAESLINFVLMLGIYPILGYNLAHNVEDGFIVPFTVFCIVMLISSVFAIGMRVTVWTGANLYTVQEQISYALIKNRIGFEIDNSEGHRIRTNKRFRSIVLTESYFNKSNKYVIYKGLWTPSQILKLTEELVSGLGTDMAVPKNEWLRLLLPVAVTFAVGVWFVTWR